MRRCIVLLIILVVSAVWNNVLGQFMIENLGRESLVRVGMNPHPSQTRDSIIADSLFNALKNQDIACVEQLAGYYRNMSCVDSLKEKSYGSMSYLLNRWVSTKKGLTLPESDFLTDDLYTYFMSNNCERLLDYLTIKYTLNHYKPQSIKRFIDQRTFYDDFLMFNNPDRETWDCTEKIISLLPVKKGDRIVDVGCGFGYYSIRLAAKVGKRGLVYGTDTEKNYVDYFGEVLKKNKVANVRAVHTDSKHLGVDDSIDAIFISSLYHIIYTWSREDERLSFMHSIQERLKKGGYLIIVDNNNLHGEELNNCHVDPRLVEAQLYYYGYEKVCLHILSQQRYMLVMRYVGDHESIIKQNCHSGDCIEVNSTKSVVHIGSLDSYDITELGIDAARYVYEYACGGDPRLASVAINKYKSLIPTENFGGEYSALQWLCEVWTANDASRKQMLSDPMNASFYHYLTDDSCSVLRYYLLHKYKLGSEQERMLSDSLLELSGEVGRTHRSYLEDYILALNPKRPLWEKTDEIMNLMALKPNDTIVDIGCGSGYYSYRFSNAVGNKGLVMAVELKGEHLDRLTSFINEQKISNIKVIEGMEDSLNIEGKVDCMFMCSLYHIYYGVISDRMRDRYLSSLVGHLRRDGRLVIVDNGPVNETTLPYHGPYIMKELIVRQLSHYGLEVESFYQIIPQRYMIVFKKK